MNTNLVVHLVPSWLVWGRNQVYCACETAQAAHKLILQSRQQGLRAYSPNIYTVGIEEVVRVWQSSQK